MTKSQRIGFMLIGGLGILLLFGILLTFGARMAHADGYLPNQEGYKDEATIYTHKPLIKRARYEDRSLREYVSASELRELERIKRRAEARRRARLADTGPVIPPRPRYTEARVIREDYEDERPTKRCLGVVKAVSKPMYGEARALKEAKRNWSVLVSEEYSGSYNSVRTAKVISSTCKPLHEGAWRYECRFVARPCRD